MRAFTSSSFFCSVLLVAGVARAVTLPGSLLSLSVLHARQTLDPADIPPECRSSCNTFVNAFQTCSGSTDPSCLCTTAVNTGLVSCFDCLLGLIPNPDPSLVTQSQSSVEQYEDACKAAGFSLPSLTITAGGAPSTPPPASPPPSSSKNTSRTPPPTPPSPSTTPPTTPTPTPTPTPEPIPQPSPTTSVDTSSSSVTTPVNPSLLSSDSISHRTVSALPTGPGNALPSGASGSGTPVPTGAGATSGAVAIGGGFQVQLVGQFLLGAVMWHFVQRMF